MQVAPTSAARRPTVHRPSRNVSGIAAVPVIKDTSRIDSAGLLRRPFVAQAKMKYSGGEVSWLLSTNRRTRDRLCPVTMK